ncbi:MAG: amino acid permease, partial [Oscillospiraceae bacterium]|nr:amino acid permease [Oscillospiraceae bacterium]
MPSNAEGKTSSRAYLTPLGAWALSFGCSVGWGAFVMPGTTFLPVAGPVGTALGIALGGLVMLVLGLNYHYLMNRFAGSGGVYSYTKNTFGYDHGFISAWFMLLTYVAIIWANATALPLIARTVLGSTFQFGFDYVVAGFHIYFGEILLAVFSLVIAAFICLRRSLSQWVQGVMALVLLVGAAICFAAGMAKGGTGAMTPAFAPAHSPFGGVFTIFALAPWAFVGFESISHSAAEAKFPLKRTFPILAVSVVTATAAYIMLTLLAVTAMPNGIGSWPEYVEKMGEFSGTASQPAFFAAESALGTAGSVILCLAALGAIFTGLIGNYIALSRLITSMSDDSLLPAWLGKREGDNVPRNAILAIMAVSAVLPFLGRTAISWIVDVTTVGATIAYAFASASAWKLARQEKKTGRSVLGILGVVISLLFALEFLIPNITSVKTLATESYLILAFWSILGFLYFRGILKKDKERRFGRSTVAWVILLGLIIFTSSVWMRQTTENAIENSIVPIQTYYTDLLARAGVDTVTAATKPSYAYLQETMEKINTSFGIAIIIQMALIVGALLILFDINARMQRREKQIEVEKALAEDASRAKTSFLSNMSHEIRTPMNAIIGLDNIALRNPELQPQTREQLEKIGASARHLLSLINDILDMSRIESGRMVLKNEEFLFSDFLEQINIIINGQCQDKGLTYECTVTGSAADYYFGDDMK